MDINTPLLDLELIVGSETNCVLKANRTTLLCRGTKEYCLSVRAELLTNRGYTTPADWDLEWGHHKGSTWLPTELGSKLVCWLHPESYHLTTDTGNPNDIAKWEDKSGNGIEFHNLTDEDRQPHKDTYDLNGFYGAIFDGVDDAIYGDAHGDGDEFDVGTNDFHVFVLFEHGANSSSEDVLFSTDAARDFSVSLAMANGTYKIYFGGGSTETDSGTTWYSEDDISIIGAGRESSGQQAFRQNGGDNIFPTGTNSSSLSSAHQFMIGGKQGLVYPTIASNEWKGTLYEFIFIDGDLSTKEREQVEGYLAHKYNQASLLPSTHTYKTRPPREVY